MARKKYEATPELRGKVEAYVACGVRQDEIALVLGVAEATLRRYYARELEMGSTLANARVASGLFDLATNEKHPAPARVQASIAWLKMRAGWSDRSDDAVRLNVTATNVQIDASTKVLHAEVRTLPDDALKTLTEVLGRLLPEGAS